MTLSTPTSEKTECEAVLYWLINEIIVWLFFFPDYQLEERKPGFWSQFNSPELSPGGVSRYGHGVTRGATYHFLKFHPW